MQLYLENMLPLINEIILYKSEFYRFVVGGDFCTHCKMFSFKPNFICYLANSQWDCQNKRFLGKYDSCFYGPYV